MPLPLPHPDPLEQPQPTRAEVLDAAELVRDWLMHPYRHHGAPVSAIRTLVTWAV
jgi:hypothetical protein